MGFVKSTEELREIEQLLATPRVVNGEAVAVQFLLDARAHAMLIPPPLRPAEQPLATLILGRWQTTFAGDTAGAMLHLSVTHDSVEGSYPLIGWYDSEFMVTFTRDILGEPTRLATSGLYRSGGHVRGWIDRHGVRLIDLDVDLGPEEVVDQHPSGVRSTGVVFNLRAHTGPAAGADLDADPQLTRVDTASTIFSRRRGGARMEIRGGPHDPLDDLLVTDIRTAEFVEFEQTSTTEVLARVPAADFLPFHYGRGDNWPLLGAQYGLISEARSDTWL